MPTLPRAHPQAAAYVIGERCAELLSGQPSARVLATTSR
jgi:hypothetical protein